MPFSTRLIHTIIVYNLISGGEDYYGNPEEVYDDGVSVPAWVWPAETIEDDLDRQTSVSRYKVLAQLDCNVDRTSKIEFEGRMHEVIGRPHVVPNRNGDHHVEIAMKLEEG